MSLSSPTTTPSTSNLTVTTTVIPSTNELPLSTPTNPLPLSTSLTSPPSSSTSTSTSPSTNTTDTLSSSISSLATSGGEIDVSKKIVLLRRPNSTPSTPSTPTPSSSNTTSSTNINSTISNKVEVLPEVTIISTMKDNEGIEMKSINNIDKVEDTLSSELGQEEKVDLEKEELVLNHALITALNHPRDRILLLRAEFELELFLADATRTRLPLSPPHFTPSLNSYQRLLIHRLADTFGITREVEPLHNNGGITANWNPLGGTSGGMLPVGVVVLVKGVDTKLPLKKLIYYVPHTPINREGFSTSSSPSFSLPSTPISLSSPSSPAYTSSPRLLSLSSVGPINNNNNNNPSFTSTTSSVPTPPLTPSINSSSLSNVSIPIPQVFKILPRGGTLPSSSNSTQSSSSFGTNGNDDDVDSSNGNKDNSKSRNKTLEEREAAYKEARERIFNLNLNSDVESVVGGIDELRPAVLGSGVGPTPSLRPSAPSFNPPQSNVSNISGSGGINSSTSGTGNGDNWASLQLQQQQQINRSQNFTQSPIPIQVTAPPPPEPYIPSSVAYPLPQSTRTSIPTVSTSIPKPLSIPVVWPPIKVTSPINSIIKPIPVPVVVAKEIKPGYIMRFEDGGLAYSSVASGSTSNLSSTATNSEFQFKNGKRSNSVATDISETSSTTSHSTSNSISRTTSSNSNVRSSSTTSSGLNLSTTLSGINGKKKSHSGSISSSISSSSEKGKGKGKEMKKKLSSSSNTSTSGRKDVEIIPHSSLPAKPTWVTTLPPVDRSVLLGGSISTGLEASSSYSGGGGEESSERGSSSSIAGDGNVSIRTTRRTISLPIANSTSNFSTTSNGSSPIIYSPPHPLNTHHTHHHIVYPSPPLPPSTSNVNIGNNNNNNNQLLSSTITPQSFFPINYFAQQQQQMQQQQQQMQLQQQQQQQQPLISPPLPPSWWDPNLQPPSLQPQMIPPSLSQMNQEYYQQLPYPHPQQYHYQLPHSNQSQPQSSASIPQQSLYEQQLLIQLEQQQQQLILQQQHLNLNLQQQQKRSEDELMSMGEMRRPPPRSTELFDPSSRRNTNEIRRTSSGPGSSRTST